MTAEDEIRLVISDVDQNGEGVALAEGAGGRELHVAGALPGEEVSARIDGISSHGRAGWATLRKVHRVSGERVAPLCRAYGRCGGCVLQHWDISAQVSWKEAWLRARVAAEPALAGTPVLPMVASPLTRGYRNNAKLVPALAPSGALLLGAYARRSHDVVDLVGCAITEPPLEIAAAVLRELLSEHRVEPYHETRLTGTLRYVVLRANAAGAVLVTLVTTNEAFPAGEKVAAALRARQPSVVGVVNNINPSRGNAIYGAHQRTLAGSAEIDDQIGAVHLRISSRAFFQANRHVARAAYEAIAREVALTGKERVVDAYAGVGGIALTLAPQADMVIGLEEHVEAVENARIAATMNRVQNTTFIAGDVNAHLGAITAADVVVLNPPRKGCSATVLLQVAMLRPRTIAYLSCAPETLLRDLAALAKLNYRTTRIIPFDMLPHTPHIEALAIVARE